MILLPGFASSGYLLKITLVPSICSFFNSPAVFIEGQICEKKSRFFSR